MSDEKKLELWRISNFADLSGTGGVLAGAAIANMPLVPLKYW